MLIAHCPLTKEDGARARHNVFLHHIFFQSGPPSMSELEARLELAPPPTSIVGLKIPDPLLCYCLFFILNHCVQKKWKKEAADRPVDRRIPLQCQSTYC